MRAVALGLGLAAACSRGERGADSSRPAPSAAAAVAAASPAPPVAVPARLLTAPERPGARDLDLQRAWRSAAVTQDLADGEQPYRFRPFFDLVVLGGSGHRSLLLLPSRGGAPSVARFRIAIPAGVDAEFVAWVAIAPATIASSDGVDFGLSITADGASPSELRFERLSSDEARRGWRPVRVDLGAYAGKTVRIDLASRESGDQSGDWLLWGDPRVVVAPPAAPLVIDLAAPKAALRRDLRLPWSEANLYKTYSVFRDGEEIDPAWITRPFPWLRSFRLFSSLGANWGPTLEAKYASEMGKNPVQDPRWESEHARRYEFFRVGDAWRDRPLREQFDWTGFDRVNARAAAAGLELHFNLSGAPEAFTGDEGEYQTFHFNEMPVVDAAGWQQYLDVLFSHLAAQPWFPRTHFSFFTEPNCLWVEADGTVRHFGFEGDAAQYGKQYLWTWNALKRYLAPGQLHLGPFVVEPDHADGTTDNLPAFLGAVRGELERANEPLPPWSGFAFNIYETPQIGLDDFASFKVAYARDLVKTEFPDRSLPLRFDEFGIHPILFPAFKADTGKALLSTRWAMTWHADMLALLLDEGIQSAGSWLHVYLLQEQHDSTPYLAELFLTRVVHGADLAINDGWIAPTPPADAAAPKDVYVRRASEDADRVGYVWSRGEDGGARLALWRHPRFIASDAQLDAEKDAKEVLVRLPAEKAGQRFRVHLLAPQGQAIPTLESARETSATVQPFPNLPKLAVVDGTTQGEIRFSVRPGDLFYLEADPGAGTQS